MFTLMLALEVPPLSVEHVSEISTLLPMIILTMESQVETKPPSNAVLTIGSPAETENLLTETSGTTPASTGAAARMKDRAKR